MLKRIRNLFRKKSIYVYDQKTTLKIKMFPRMKGDLSFLFWKFHDEAQIFLNLTVFLQFDLEDFVIGDNQTYGKLPFDEDGADEFMLDLINIFFSQNEVLNYLAMTHGFDIFSYSLKSAQGFLDELKYQS